MGPGARPGNATGRQRRSVAARASVQSSRTVGSCACCAFLGSAAARAGTAQVRGTAHGCRTRAGRRRGRARRIHSPVRPGPAAGNHHPAQRGGRRSGTGVKHGPGREAGQRNGTTGAQRSNAVAGRGTGMKRAPGRGTGRRNNTTARRTGARVRDAGPGGAVESRGRTAPWMRAANPFTSPAQRQGIIIRCKGEAGTPGQGGATT